LTLFARCCALAPAEDIGRYLPAALGKASAAIDQRDKQTDCYIEPAPLEADSVNNPNSNPNYP